MAGIFLIDKDMQLTEMRTSQYLLEKEIQTLIAKFPRLVSCSADEEEEANWLLISSEFRIPDSDEGSARWPIDHLFVDEDGIPVLVEVKRSSDSRIRREVVGQMLDYCANAVVYLPLERITQNFEAQCAKENLDPEERLASFIVDGTDPSEFWQKVKTNLQAGRIKMLFVADEIPTELKRIIEFLNVQMDPAEVLGVEVKRFAADDHQTIVPVVIGKTAIAASRKRTTARSSSEILPALDAVVTEFNKISNGLYRTTGAAGNYRQIKLQGFPARLHYEFLSSRKDGVTAQFHIESEKFRHLGSSLKEFAESDSGGFSGARLEFEPTWCQGLGRLRVLPVEQCSAAQIAQHMLKLIEQTKSLLSQKIQEGNT